MYCSGITVGNAEDATEEAIEHLLPARPVAATAPDEEEWDGYEDVMIGFVAA